MMKEEVMDKEKTVLKLNKQEFSIISLSDPSDDKEYLLEKKPIERLKYIEMLRRINYGHGATAGLQRFFEVAER